MSDGAEYTPDEIEELGTGPMNDLANYYDDIAALVKAAGAMRDSAFQDEGVGGRWNDLFNLLQDGCNESAVNIRYLSQALVATAEDQRGAEWATAAELDALAADLEGQYNTEVTEGADAPTPSENHPVPPAAGDYDEALSGE